VGDQPHASDSLPPSKSPVPALQEAGSASGPVLTDAVNLAITKIRSPDYPATSESLSQPNYQTYLE